MEQLAQLVREVERVVTAPYVPSLQGLYDLLQQGLTSSIDSWAHCKPCQVGLLADILVEALSRSRVALPLISAFVTASDFRDALLERHPVILDAFLEKAVNGDEPEYCSACIALFSSPLPENFVPPARTTPFVAKLVSVMAANPCVETVTPIHALITGLKGSPRVLDDIPSKVMSNMQLEFTKTLRNLEEHMGNLLCLATFAQIATGRTTSQHQQGSEGQWLLNIKHFFGAKRGIKTLDLVVLRVILACSSSCNLGPQDATESIRLAITIADAIEPEQKQAWIASHSAKISKLCDKAIRDGLHSGIHIMAILFLHALLPAQSLSSQLRELGLKTLLSKNSQETLKSISPQLITRLAKSLAGTGESATRELVNFTTAALKGRETMTTLRLAHLILAGLQERSEETRLSFSSSAGSLGHVIEEMIEYFPRQPSESQCHGANVCTSQLCIMQNQLFLMLLNLYNTISLIGGDVIIRSFVKRVEQSLPSMHCAFSKASPSNFQESVTLCGKMEFSSTKISRNWRAGVTDVFRQNAETSYDSMMRKIEDTCFDLERRCEDVEGPLRVVEEERDKCAQENEQLRMQNEELDNQLKQTSNEVEQARRQSSEHLAEFGHEHTRLEQLLQEQYAYRDELTASIESIRVELREQQQSSESALIAERERARSKDLEMMATVTEKDDQIEDLQEEIRGLETRNERTSQTLAQLLEDNETSREALSSLELRLAGATQSLEQYRTLNAQKDDEINRLLSQEEDLRKALGSLETTRAQQNMEIDRLTSTLQQLQQSEERLQAEIERMSHAAEEQTSRAMAEMAKKNAETQRLQAAMQTATRDAYRDAQSKDKRIQHLERKVQALRDERAAKAREFSEAQQHIGRLMGVMGFSANAPESTAPNHQRRRSSTNQTPAARIPQQISDDEEETQTQSSQYMTTGPTPKRPRGNRKPALPHTTNTFSAATPKARSPPIGTRSVRKPLADADPNSPTKTPSSNKSKHSQVDLLPETQVQGIFEEDHLQDLDLDMDLEFSKDFLFSSTAFTGSNEQAELQ